MNGRKIIKLIKKYSVLFITFLVISVIILVTINNILTVFDVVNKSNSIYSKNAVKLNVSMDARDISLEELIDYFSKRDECVFIGNMSRLFDDKFTVNGIYKGENCKNKFTLISGREFSADNYKNKDKVAIIKDSIYDSLLSDNELELKDNKEYITYDGQLYEVVGIIDSDKDQESQDIYLNFYSLANDDGSISQYNYIYDNGIDTREDIEKLSQLSSQTQFAVEDLSRGLKAFNESLDISRIYIISTLLLSIVCVITIINVSGYWFVKEKKRLGITKLLGGTNGNLIALLFGDYIKVSGISIIFGIIIFEIIKNIDTFKYVFQYRTSILFDVISVVVLSAFLFMFVIISLIKPIINVVKMEINTIIKGEE